MASGWGPPSLRVFARANPFFVAWWTFILSFISIAMWAGVVRSLPLLLPLAIATGAAATTCVMFAFSHGWIADGD
jgi:hypothetical membrane protein